MRYLAIDLGDKRTGLAVGDDSVNIASPLETIDVGLPDGPDALARAIQRAIDKYVGAAPCQLVLGLPLNMDGSDSPRAKQTRELARHLEAKLGRPVHLADERLTSADADWQMARTGLTHKQKKARRDALAAANLLSDFLKSKHEQNDHPGPPGPQSPSA